MPEPAYVSIAGEYARRIRSGDIAPGSQLPSYAEIAQQNGVSDIVVRKAIELLQGQGLVRSVRRRGIFVTHRPSLVRISPERQMQDAETSFRNEAVSTVNVVREVARIPATKELADALSVSPGDEIVHVVTKASEGGRPISISDTYQPPDVTGVSLAAYLEETLSDRLPVETHSEWLRTTPGDLVKRVSQRFITFNGRVIMLSDISYPRDRYDSYTFRMALNG
ncbi:GntR family transcriptional regulator [Virgisporangium aliadipatigenens]|uniref:GntR family transcriptional regulator n=1 Tax=Virgisporangium aliadipatigenens TaxID=741659 RepID=A0A8J3YNW0_9ACTN|nr:GntR family transcriptional regulator [Virgisporangium aliadipatigenens]GIJ47241.1 GntR family transcriptional regulator [Virgisporangium aliadipatigenens]